MQVLLEAPGAYCSVNGLYLTSDNQHIDNLISIDHAKANTTSRLYFKGILDGKSKAVFGGQVLVRKDAQKADAQQTDKNLLLSDQAEVDSKPSLLIYADDVKCSHGATAGNIDENALFYLRSRGLDREAASRMLIHSFAREIIETVKPEALQMYLDRLFLRAMPAIGFPSGGGP
jgi:Fe-S cluster assembly protein SufD